MLLRKITQDTSVVCEVSTHSGLFQVCTRSGIVQILKYLHSYRLFIHSLYKYIIKTLIFFTGWLGRDQDCRGTGTSKGFKEWAGLQTINPEIHSQRERSTQGPDPPAFPLFSCLTRILMMHLVLLLP